MRPRNVTIVPVEADDSLWRGFGLPPDLQARARGRVAQFGLLMSAVVAVVFASSGPVWQDFAPESTLFIVRVMQGVILLLSLTVFAIARGSGLSHTNVLYLGLLYEFLFCLTVSVGYNWFTGTAFGIFAAVNLSTIVIAVYPMIVPSPLSLTLVTAVASAATAPVGLLVASKLGSLPISAADYIGVSTYPALCVGIAVLGSRIIYGLNRDVASARELGSYHLREVLGLGGMGQVWRAEHRMLARPAAIKLVRPDDDGRRSGAADHRLQQRFEREAQVTASLQSPHTVALFDFGRAADGTYYYVMELLDGIDLQALVDRYGPVPPGRVCHLLAQVCHSLAEAHDAGLVHRDIKPANILTCRYSREYDFVKVLDFGLVSLRREVDDGRNPTLTAQGVFGGTPTYLAPEVAEGQLADGRADLYALGCVAYWLLTGRTVFEGESPLAIMLAHVRERPVPPSRISELGIPPALDDLVLACLEKDPANRPASADELRIRLESCPTVDVWTQEQARQWWDLHRPTASTDARTTLSASTLTVASPQ
jgi:serine/threonine protein kinase